VVGLHRESDADAERDETVCEMASQPMSVSESGEVVGDTVVGGRDDGATLAPTAGFQDQVRKRSASSKQEECASRRERVSGRMHLTCRIPPPNILRNQRTFLMKSCGPTRTLHRAEIAERRYFPLEVAEWIRANKTHLPMGAPRPLLKQRLTESNGSHSSAIECPVYTEGSGWGGRVRSRSGRKRIGTPLKRCGELKFETHFG
jgi:hypothetical protein